MARHARGTPTLDRESEEVRSIRERVSIQFTGSPTERDTNFGDFCVALTTATTRFTIAGDRTLIMDKETFEHLSGVPRKLYEKYLKNKNIQVEIVTIGGQRYLIPREEAKKRARWYMQNR